MKTKLWFALALVALLAASCTKDNDPTPTLSPGGEKSYNKTIDSYLSSYYLWNTDYKAMRRDLTLNYASDADNFLTRTLLAMTTNTLDKKSDGQGGYQIYSNITRTSQNTTKATGAINNGVEKEQEESYGFVNFGTVKFSNAAFMGLYVAAVYPDSPADKAGFGRGTIFLQFNGKNLYTDEDINNMWQALMYPATDDRIDLLQNETDAPTVTLSAQALYPNPVLQSQIIDDGAHTIGYLVYLGFDAAYDNELLSAIQSFRDAGITDLVLDLRYNGGGHLISSNMLSTCIAGSRADGKVFEYYRYNDDRMADPTATAHYTGNTYNQSANLFYENFDYGDYYGVDLRQNTLDRLQHLYVLTSSNTASASETVINSLRGVDMPVTLVGGHTNGKNVGMEVKTFDDGGYTYTLTPITFQSYNAKQQTVDYQRGISPDYPVDEMQYDIVAFGPEDPLVAKALSLIDPDTYAPLPEPTRVAGAPAFQPLPMPADPRHPSGMIVLPHSQEE